MRYSLLFIALLVAAVFEDSGGPEQSALRGTSPDALGSLDLAPGSMGPKVETAAFVGAGEKLAGIGQLTEARAILEGRAGTRVPPDVTEDL